MLFELTSFNACDSFENIGETCVEYARKNECFPYSNFEEWPHGHVSRGAGTPCELCRTTECPEKRVIWPNSAVVYRERAKIRKGESCCNCCYFQRRVARAMEALCSLNYCFDSDFRGHEQEAYIELAHAQRDCNWLIRKMGQVARNNGGTIDITARFNCPSVEGLILKSLTNTVWSFIARLGYYCRVLKLRYDADFVKDSPFNGTAQVREFKPLLPLTYRDCEVKDGWYTHRTTWQRGYVSRKIDILDQSIHIVPRGKYKGALYVLMPSWDSTQYCERHYVYATHG